MAAQGFAGWQVSIEEFMNGLTKLTALSNVVNGWLHDKPTVEQV